MPFGPDGGDARAFGADPHDHRHLFLGTATGWIYQSHDGGSHWERLAQVGHRNDLVLDNIVVDARDSRHLIVGAWVLDHPDGGLYESHDAGQSWTRSADLAGQSVRALAQAPSDAKILVAGTLQGVYQSSDGGSHWRLISPAGSTEIHEVESIAIDPTDPRVIYAGTWHLPWKTADGGAHWKNVKNGVIDDSDVFSIIVDPKQPKVVFASACSGIYKSEDGGDKFRKIQGIPATARRTRVLMQDPQRLETVFAGTTEGLYRTDDAGTTWVRTTEPELIVNDVYVDPADSKHVLLATDRGGVLASQDRGTSFVPSNAGFSARQITAYVAEATRPSHLYVGVVNDKEWGGVFASSNGGFSWEQDSTGLLGRDVFALVQASDGSILAGTSHGIYRLNTGVWTRVGDAAASREQVAELAERGQALPVEPRPAARAVATPVAKRHAGHGGSPAHTPVRSQPAARAVNDFDGSVLAMAVLGDRLFAATTEGLLTSVTAGTTWTRVEALGLQSLQYVAAAQNVVVVGSLAGGSVSRDGGSTWKPLTLPAGVTQLTALTVDATGGVWAGGRDGAYYSVDGGMSWYAPERVVIRDVNNIYSDAANGRVLITTGKGTMVFAVRVADHVARYWDAGWSLRFVRPVGDYLVGATLFDGIVVQPRMVDSREVAQHEPTQAGLK
ncbi:MAG: hypothetical protein KGK08_08065 [Acidobacteriota bacterium]|nr:hypothetical protein [Acidobacteriota bacterium]